MPDALPAWNTDRYYLTYNAVGAQHTMTIRVDSVVTDGELSETVGAFLETMSPLVGDSSFVRLERSAEGTNVRLPATWSGPDSWGDGGVPEGVPYAWSFTGKSAAGHKWLTELFGRSVSGGAHYRVNAGDDAVIAAAIADLNDSTFIWLAIDGASPIINPYANASVNAYWQRKVRVS